MTWLTVARTSEIPPERIGVYAVGDHEVAICNLDGEFYAIDDLCTHDGGSLDQGQLDGDQVECPRHGARFDVRSGRAVQLPAFQPVETHAVRLDGDAIQVEVEHR